MARKGKSVKRRVEEGFKDVVGHVTAEMMKRDRLSVRKSISQIPLHKLPKLTCLSSIHITIL
jgi:hypothetical protein